MRKAVGVALIAIVILLLVLLIPPAAKNNATPAAGAAQGKSAPASLGIYSAEISDSGDGTVAVLHMFASGDDGGKFFAYCSDAQIPDSVLVLNHPRVPGVPSGMAQEIEKSLARCGFSYDEVSAKDALSWKDAVIVAPTGALPQIFENRSALLSERNLRLVVAQSIAGRTIDLNGTIAPQQSPPPSGYEAIALSPSHENDSVPEIVLAALASKGAAQSEISGRGKEVTLPIPLKEGQGIAHCRIYQISDSSCRFADSAKISKPGGELHAASSALDGQETDFEFSLSGQESGRRLILYAVDYAGREEVSRREIAEGTVAGGWAGRFSLAMKREGSHTVWIVDQFGRRHASAFLEVRGFSASFSKMGGNRLEFSVESSGRPLTGDVVAWIDEGEKKQFHAANGTLVVWAAPAPGRHTLYLSYLGMVRQQEIVFSESPLGNYLRLLLPALLFLLAIFLLLRAGSRVKYRILFPEFAPGAGAEAKVCEDDLIAAWESADGKLGSHRLPAHAEEIGRCLAKKLGGKQAAGAVGGNAGEITVNPQSLRLALRPLVKSGVFLESEGQYIPSKYADGFSAWQNRALRIAHDLLLERGLPFSKGKIVQVKKLGLEIVPFSGRDCVLGRIGTRRRIIVFEDEMELRAFRKTLAGPDGETVRIKIAEQNGKVVFAPATRKGLEAALP